ncbi:MAG: TetR/AcrR family transcriptional regulator [Motiliproteus sp.]
MAQVKVGRPNKFDREAAIDIAKNAFWMQGYHALSVNQLASIMGITRSSLYNSFGDKQGLFKEALAAYNAASPIALLQNLPADAQVIPALQAFFRENCRSRIQDQGKQGCLMVNTIGEVIGSDDDLAGEIEAMLLQSIELFEQLIERAVTQNEITRPCDAHAIASAITAFLMGFSNLSQVIRDEQQLWNLCQTFLKNYGLE